MAKRNRF